MKDKEYSYNIENIKYILIILIIILHSRPINQIPSGNIIYEIYRFIGVVADIAVPAYFFLSSFLYFKNFELNKYSHKLSNRIRTVLIPYLLWNSIMFLYYAFLNSLTVIDNLNISNDINFTLNSFLSCLLESKAVPQLWFLKDLMIFFVFTPILFLIIKKTKSKFAQISVYLLLVCLITYFKPGYSNVLFWIPVLYLGGICGYYYKKINCFQKKKFMDILMPLILLALSIIAFISNNPNGTIYTIYRLLSPIFLLYILDCKKLDKKIINSPYVDQFFIFCSHLAIIEVYRKIILNIISYDIYLSLIGFILTIVLTLITIFIITYILKKYFKKIYFIFTGNR